MRDHATVLVVAKLSAHRHQLMHLLSLKILNGCLAKSFLRHILVMVALAFNFVASAAQHSVGFLMTPFTGLLWAALMVIQTLSWAGTYMLAQRQAGKLFPRELLSTKGLCQKMYNK